MSPLRIEISDSYSTLTIEGVRCSAEFIKEFFTNPPAASLLNIKRVENTLVFQKFDTAEGAAEFFAEGATASPAPDQ